jgi:hypothetical protein
MAEERFVLPVNGMGAQETDINLWAKNAALADDRVLAELLRLAPFTAGTPTKAVTPYGVQGASAIVVPSGSSDATVRVRPFRAIVGSRDTIANIGHKDNWRDIRSALHVPNSASGQWRDVQLSATAANNRWDLIWARMDVDVGSGTVSRLVKNPSTGLGEPALAVVSRLCEVSIGVTEGAEAGSPTGPALPSDSGDAYYLPLAYVYLTHPHTLIAAVGDKAIYEVAPVVTQQTGALGVRPFSGSSDPSGWASATAWDGVRSRRYVPSSMAGGVSRFGNLGALPNGTHVLDSSVDWRKRFVRWFVQGAGSSHYGGPSALPGDAGVAQQVGGAVTIHPSADPVVCRMAASDSGSTGANVLTAGVSAVCLVQVNASTGNLEAVVTNGPLQTTVFLWLDVMGQFDTMSTS